MTQRFCEDPDDFQGFEGFADFDAFEDVDLEILEMPLSPNRLFELLKQKES